MPLVFQFRVTKLRPFRSWSILEICGMRCRAHVPAGLFVLKVRWAACFVCTCSASAMRPTTLLKLYSCSSTKRAGYAQGQAVMEDFLAQFVYSKPLSEFLETSPSSCSTSASYRGAGAQSKALAALPAVPAFPTEERIRAKERKAAGIQPKKRKKFCDQHFDDCGADFSGLGPKEMDEAAQAAHYVEER